MLWSTKRGSLRTKNGFTEMDVLNTDPWDTFDGRTAGLSDLPDLSVDELKGFKCQTRETALCLKALQTACVTQYTIPTTGDSGLIGDL
jgi:hypothetical protein